MYDIEKPLQKIRIHSHCKIGSFSRCLLVALYVIIFKISVHYRTVQYRYMLRTTAIVLLLSDWYFLKISSYIIVLRQSLGTGFVWFDLRALPEQVKFLRKNLLHS